MPALAADITAATRPNGVTLDTQQSTAVQADFPNARDGSLDPSAGFFDSMADAATVNAARFALLSAPRRRFRCEADGILPELASGNVTPTVTAIDSEVAANGPFLVSRVVYDLDSERTQVEIYG